VALALLLGEREGGEEGKEGGSGEERERGRRCLLAGIELHAQTPVHGLGFSFRV
jgi:hypothetical protein